MNSANTVTISTNYWKVPSVENAFAGWLEGEPTEKEREETIRKTLAKRKAWKPSNKGLALVAQLAAFVGSRVKIQFWDSCMCMFEEEAPFPVQCDLVGVILKEVDGFTQAFLRVKGVKEITTPEGYSPSAYYFSTEADSDVLLASFANLYEVTELGRIAS